MLVVVKTTVITTRISKIIKRMLAALVVIVCLCFNGEDILIVKISLCSGS